MDRRTFGDDLTVLVPTTLERRGFLAAFTERTGGVSTGPYASLNLGMRTGDRAARVLENRERVTRSLGVPAFAAAEQVHGGAIARLGPGRAGAGFTDPRTAIPGADALAVTRRGLPVAVLTADCLPIALASAKEGRMVAIHAGWRGLAAGIVDRALGAFGSLQGLAAAIGPAIGPCHYEVGEDVALAVTAGSPAGAVVDRREGTIRLDLGATAARILRAAGLRAVDRSEVCTACEPERFFSHRREGRTGRQALVATRL